MTETQVIHAIRNTTISYHPFYLFIIQLYICKNTYMYHIYAIFYYYYF
jgi:hypothetical protein